LHEQTIVKRRRAFDILVIVCAVIVLVTLDVGLRDGKVTVYLSWFQLPLLAAPVAWVMLHNKREMEERLRAERRAARLCARCAYDVRANPERCPECGEAIEKVMTAETTGRVHQ
jgi:hypothetical protein